MFLDEGTTGILIEENIIWNIARSPLRFHQAGKNMVRKNHLYRTSEDIPMVRYNKTPEENITFEDNEDRIGTPALTSPPPGWPGEAFRTCLALWTFLRPEGPSLCQLRASPGVGSRRLPSL